MLSSKIKQQLLQYSAIRIPYHKVQKVHSRISGGSHKHWGTPAPRLIASLYKLYKFFKQHLFSFKAEGCENVWIVKPSGNSK